MALDGGARVLRAGSTGRHISLHSNRAINTAWEGTSKETPSVEIEPVPPHIGFGDFFEPFSSQQEKKLEAATAEVSSPSEETHTKHVNAILCQYWSKSSSASTATIEVLIKGEAIIKTAIGVLANSEEVPAIFTLSGFPIMPLRKADKLTVKITSPNAEGTVIASLWGHIFESLEAGGS
jgi:hypothetical protein